MIKTCVFEIRFSEMKAAYCSFCLVVEAINIQELMLFLNPKFLIRDKSILELEIL